MKLGFLPFVFVSFGHFNDKIIYTNYNRNNKFCQIFKDFFNINFINTKTLPHNTKLLSRNTNKQSPKPPLKMKHKQGEPKEYFSLLNSISINNVVACIYKQKS